MIDLSVIVNIHREGRLIHPTLVNVRDCVAVAEADGWVVEVILVCDRTDPGTFAYLDEFAPSIFADIEWFQLAVDHGDLGLSRNSGVAFARGRLIALSDDDNLYSHNWFSDAIASLSDSDDDVVVHPEFMVQFGASNVLWKTPRSDDNSFAPEGLYEHNYWDAAAIAPRALYERVPFVPSLAGPGFGPEDWHWNAEALLAGASHRVVPGTALFYRVKSRGSLLTLLIGSNSILAPTAYLRRNLRAEERASGAPREVTEPLRDSDNQQVQEPTLPRPRGAALLGAVRALARLLARLVWPVARAIGRIHPRIHAYGRALLDAHRQLLAPPAPRMPMPDSRVDDARSVEELPGWLVDAWATLHATEPLLFPGQATLESLVRWEPTPGLQSECYWELVDRVMTDDDWSPEFVFLIPWLAPGGGTHVLHNYVTAIRESNPGARILVLSTNPSRGAVSGARLADGSVRYVDVPEGFGLLPADLQDRLLATFLVQFGPRVVHLINSPVGYRVFEKYARPLASRSRLYVSLFTLDRTPEGRVSHYVLDGVRHYIDYLSGVFVDNEPLIGDLERLLGLSRSTFELHRQPISLTTRHEKPVGDNRRRDRLRVLWAARFDRQKRPDVLVKVAKRTKAAGLPVDFFASGLAVLDAEGDVLTTFKKAGVRYLGPFDGSITSLDGRFDALLLTSEWEGLPLTLIDAALSDLVIIAPAVGGVPDFVRHDQTGFLIDRFDDVQSYIDAIARLLADEPEAQRLARNAKQLAAERHSWSSFVASLTEAKGYLS